jgi:enolase-phosphatase E1
MIRAIVTDIEGTTSDILLSTTFCFRTPANGWRPLSPQQYAEPVKTILDNLRGNRQPRRQHRRTD